MARPFQDEAGHTAHHATRAGNAQTEQTPAQRPHARYAKRDISVAYARRSRKPAADATTALPAAVPLEATDAWLDLPSVWRQRIDELETILRHKDLKLQAALAENRVMRQNLHKLMRDLDVMEKVVATLGHRRRA